MESSEHISDPITLPDGKTYNDLLIAHNEGPKAEEALYPEATADKDIAHALTLQKLKNTPMNEDGEINSLVRKIVDNYDPIETPRQIELLETVFDRAIFGSEFAVRQIIERFSDSLHVEGLRTETAIKYLPEVANSEHVKPVQRLKILSTLIDGIKTDERIEANTTRLLIHFLDEPRLEPSREEQQVREESQNMIMREVSRLINSKEINSSQELLIETAVNRAINGNEKILKDLTESISDPYKPEDPGQQIISRSISAITSSSELSGSRRADFLKKFLEVDPSVTPAQVYIELTRILTNPRSDNEERNLRNSMINMSLKIISELNLLKELSEEQKHLVESLCEYALKPAGNDEFGNSIGSALYKTAESTLQFPAALEGPMKSFIRKVASGQTTNETLKQKQGKALELLS